MVSKKSKFIKTHIWLKMKLKKKILSNAILYKGGKLSVPNSPGQRGY